MKNFKYLILLLPLVLTGCFGNAGKGVLTNECVSKIETQWMTETDKYTITYKEGKVTNVVISNKYEGFDMTESMNTNKKAYEKEKGVNIKIDNNTITKEIDMNKVNSNIKEVFNLKDSYNEQIKVLTDQGYTCD